MITRHTTKGRRGVALAALAVTLALTVAGCGSGGDNDDKTESGSSASPSSSGKSKQDDTSPAEQPDSSVVLAEMKGRGGLVLVVNQVKRDSGGFVTVSGEIKNTSDGVRDTGSWAGLENGLVAANPNSVAGATLFDKAGKKRYYVLRDTDNRCLCTAAIPLINPGTVAPVFMQFPAPPEGTAEVDFSLPTFGASSVKISG